MLNRRQFSAAAIMGGLFGWLFPRRRFVPSRPGAGIRNVVIRRVTASATWGDFRVFVFDGRDVRAFFKERPADSIGIGDWQLDRLRGTMNSFRWKMPDGAAIMLLAVLVEGKPMLAGVSYLGPNEEMKRPTHSLDYQIS